MASTEIRDRSQFALPPSDGAPDGADEEPGSGLLLETGVSYNPAFLSLRELFVSRYGAERADRMSPFKSLLEAGPAGYRFGWAGQSIFEYHVGFD